METSMQGGRGGGVQRAESLKAAYFKLILISSSLMRSILVAKAHALTEVENIGMREIMR